MVNGCVDFNKNLSTCLEMVHVRCIFFFFFFFQVAFSPDGKEVLTVSGDKTAKIWNLASRQLVQ